MVDPHSDGGGTPGDVRRRYSLGEASVDDDDAESIEFSRERRSVSDSAACTRRLVECTPDFHAPERQRRCETDSALITNVAKIVRDRTTGPPPPQAAVLHASASHKDFARDRSPISVPDDSELMTEDDKVVIYLIDCLHPITPLEVVVAQPEAPLNSLPLSCGEICIVAREPHDTLAIDIFSLHGLVSSHATHIDIRCETSGSEDEITDLLSCINTNVSFPLPDGVSAESLFLKLGADHGFVVGSTPDLLSRLAESRTETRRIWFVEEPGRPRVFLRIQAV